MSGYDPRSSGNIGALHFSPKDRADLYPVKTYRPGSSRAGTPEGFGPHITHTFSGSGGPGTPTKGQRPSSAPRGTLRTGATIMGTILDRNFPSQHPAGTARRDHRRPPYLDSFGRWVQAALPQPVADTTVQPLTASATFETRVPGSGKKIRPVSAVHSYADVSPLATTDYVREPVTLVSPYSPTSSPRLTVPAPDLYSPSGMATAREAMYTTTLHGGRQGQRTTSASYGDTADWDAHMRSAEKAGVQVDAVLRASVGAMHSRRLNAAAFKLTSQDVARTQYTDLAKAVQPGGHNSRLIGGHWRLMPRPVDGDPLFTDFYGPVGGGKERASYYGRAYNDPSIY